MLQRILVKTGIDYTMLQIITIQIANEMLMKYLKS